MNVPKQLTDEDIVAILEAIEHTSGTVAQVRALWAVVAERYGKKK
jgi:hypothetical protein